jgi:hypothetical protein
MAKRTTRSAASRQRPTETPETFDNGIEQMPDRAPDMSGGGDTRSDSMASSPSEEDIRMRAYSRYLERGGGDGMDFEDWLEAERELKQRR